MFFLTSAPSIVINVKEYRTGYIEIRRRGGKIRAFTEITKDNVRYCRELFNLVDELRHVDGVKEAWPLANPSTWLQHSI